MDIITAKEHLHKEGYCDFELKDFDENAYNLLSNLKYKQGDLEYLQKFSIVRFDYLGKNGEGPIRINDIYGSYDNARKVRTDFLKKYDNDYIAQVWAMSENLPTNIEEISNVYKNILNYFYSKTTDDVFFGFQWTCYSEGDFLKDHNDGQGDYHQNVCAILIYLNEDWNPDWGGNLILRNTKYANYNNKEVKHKVVPEFGRVAIIDLEVFDTAHAVDSIIGDHNRCTLLTFATGKEEKKPKFA